MSRKIKKGKPVPKKSGSKIWLWVALGVLLVAVVGLAWLSTQSGSSSTAKSGIVSLEQAVKLRDAGAFVLDVREPEEWEAGHIPGSTLIPLGQLAGRVNEVPRDRQVVVVCRTQNRSEEGKNVLLKAGFSQVVNMYGGVSDWIAKGYPVVTGK